VSVIRHKLQRLGNGAQHVGTRDAHVKKKIFCAPQTQAPQIR
jgi:hypothetical protein